MIPAMKTTVLHGDSMRGDTPNWQPLLDLAPDDVDDFMWMFEVELEDGTRLHAYKHWETRRYLHLGLDGRAFVYCQPSSYREVDPDWLLDQALHPYGPPLGRPSR
jgi:hypothetical protein